MNFVIGILRSLRLRCPNCQQGRLMKNWFVVNTACSACGYEFQKESGDFWGSMVFSYTYAGFVAFLVSGFLITFDLLTIGQRVYAAVIGGALAIFLLHPFTRANWIAVMFLTRGHYEEYQPRKDRP